MLVAMRITNDVKSSLDNALTSTLLPQLESLPLASLAALEIFYNGRINEKDKISEYFKGAYKNPNRQSFVESFEKVLRYLELDKHEKIIDEFANGILKIDNDNLWINIESLFGNKKKNFDSDLINFKHGITDLRKSAVI